MSSPEPTPPPAPPGSPGDAVYVRPARAARPAPPPVDAGDDAPPPAGGSLLPVVVSIVAGLVVVGLMAMIMLTPHTPAAGPAAVALTVAPGGGTSGQSLARPGYLAPDFTLTALDGSQVQLSSFRGKQPVWVNFWATWCPPCRAEMPEMQKLYPQYQARGVEVLGVDVQEDQAKVQAFVQSNGYGWHFVLDTTGNVSRDYYVSGIPTHVFIGKDGVIQDLLISGLTSDMMVSHLDKLLAP